MLSVTRNDIPRIFLAVLCASMAPCSFGQERSWPDYGGGPDSSHFVESKQITKQNVKQLEVAWVYPFGETGFNPIVVDNYLYVLGRNSSLIALEQPPSASADIHNASPANSALNTPSAPAADLRNQWARKPATKYDSRPVIPIILPNRTD